MYPNCNFQSDEMICRVYMKQNGIEQVYNHSIDMLRGQGESLHAVPYTRLLSLCCWYASPIPQITLRNNNGSQTKRRQVEIT